MKMEKCLPMTLLATYPFVGRARTKNALKYRGNCGEPVVDETRFHPLKARLLVMTVAPRSCRVESTSKSSSPPAFSKAQTELVDDEQSDAVKSLLQTREDP
jgi:hypothetical protein